MNASIDLKWNAVLHLLGLIVGGAALLDTLDLREYCVVGAVPENQASLLKPQKKSHWWCVGNQVPSLWSEVQSGGKPLSKSQKDASYQDE